MNTYTALFLAAFVSLPSLAADRYAPTIAAAPTCEADDNTCIVIVQNQSFSLSDFGAIDFIGISEDSRCPVDVFCFWAGRVRVELKHQGLDSSEKFELGLGGDLTKTWIDEATGVKLSLEQVWPEKSFATPSKDPYQIKLRLVEPVQEAPAQAEGPDSPVQEGPEQDSPLGTN